jgi:acetyltransferase-like isoleucine patch superfamily enzyme
MLVFFSIGFIPLAMYLFLFYKFFDIHIIWHWLCIPVFIYGAVMIAVIFVILITGILMKIFRIRYDAGRYPYSYWNKNTFCWILVCSLYTPCRKILEIFPVAGLKNFYFRSLGMHIGKNTLVGGVIKDPCMTSVGRNTTIGEYAIIYGHITNYQDGSIHMKKVSIGDNCVIGAGAIIMPGAVIDDNVTVATGAVVTQNQHLLKGKTYVGIPAKELKSNKKAPVISEDR